MTVFFEKLDEHGRVIAFRPGLVKVSGSLAGGLLLSQLLYWHKVMSGREFYKTNKELMDETGLTLTELKSAKCLLKKGKFITTNLRGHPATTHYEINEDVILKAIPSWQESDQLDEFSKQESDQPVGGNPTHQLAGIQPTYYSEITNKITNKITPEFEAGKNWESVKEKLEEKLILHNYLTWFKPTSGIIVRSDKVLIGVPNRFYKKCLEENYSKEIRVALVEAVGFEKPPKPEFKVIAN